MMTIIDIETGPLLYSELDKVQPEFNAPGNYKDPDKIAAYLTSAREQWRKDAALSALTGRVLVIGIMQDHGTIHIVSRTEQAILDAFWQGVWGEPGEICGFAIKHFDLPFLVQRSLILGLKVPSDLWSGHYWSSRVIDLQERWLCFGRNGTGASLDAICKACGIGAKTLKGSEFAATFSKDPDVALDYLKNDLRITRLLADRMGL